MKQNDFNNLKVFNDFELEYETEELVVTEIRTFFIG